MMIDRRYLLGASAIALPAWMAAPSRHPARHHGILQRRSYALFLEQVAAEARDLGISSATIRSALSLAAPNLHVLDLDRHQPEFTLSWAQYRSRVLTDQKIQDGRSAYGGNRLQLAAISQRFQVDPGVVVAIWGLESRYGSRCGSFGVVDALASLAFDGRRASFFRTELLDALKILEHGDISSASMFGSYAGAMGQPQFMPSSYLRYAVDFNRDGKRDIWSTPADVLASISNYLAKNGWSPEAPWGQQISLPPAFDLGQSGRNAPRLLEDWMRGGVRRADGRKFRRGDVLGAVLAPDGRGGEAFMVYDNFNVIRRYNSSDFYGLAVGLLGNATT